MANSADAIVPADRLPNAHEWERLTRSPTKRTEFGTDLYFRECWYDLLDLHGERAAEVTRPVALLMLKPDAVPGRRAPAVVDYLTDHGFAPVATLPVHLGRHSMRELWRWNWDVYTADRLAMSTLLYAAADTLALVLADERDTGVPGAVRLADLKGAGDDPARRRPDQLRTVLGCPNGVLNFVHTADEPADVLREIGLFADGPLRRDVLWSLADPDPATARRELDDRIAGLHARHPAHDLDTARSADRLASSPACRAPDRLRAAVHDGRTVRWAELTAMVDPRAPGVDPWDVVCVAAAVLPLVQPGVADLMPAGSPGAWASADVAR